MPIDSGLLTERITLQRLNDTTKVYDDLAETPTVWAAAEPQGDATYRFRIRWRGDLRTKADIEPAMRVIYRGDAHDLTDIVEAELRVETHLIASRRIIEDIPELPTGARRIKVWP